MKPKKLITTDFQTRSGRPVLISALIHTNTYRFKVAAQGDI